MKNISIFLGACCILFITSCKEAEQKGNDQIASADAVNSSLNQEAELEAIMAVIDQETRCFFKRDFDCWQAQWAGSENDALTWNNADGTFVTNIGSSVASFVKNYLTENPLKEGQGSTHPEIKRENIQVKFYGDSVAYVLWKQYNSNEEGDAYNISQDFRLMEKIDGSWKIENVSSFWDYKNQVAAAEVKS